MDNSGTNTENYGIKFAPMQNTSGKPETKVKLHPLVELLRRF